MKFLDSWLNAAERVGYLDSATKEGDTYTLVVNGLDKPLNIKERYQDGVREVLLWSKADPTKLYKVVGSGVEKVLPRLIVQHFTGLKNVRFRDNENKVHLFEDVGIFPVSINNGMVRFSDGIGRKWICSDSDVPNITLAFYKLLYDGRTDMSALMMPRLTRRDDVKVLKSGVGGRKVPVIEEPKFDDIKDIPITSSVEDLMRQIPDLKEQMLFPHQGDVPDYGVAVVSGMAVSSADREFIASAERKVKGFIGSSRPGAICQICGKGYYPDDDGICPECRARGRPNSSFNRPFKGFIGSAAPKSPRICPSCGKGYYSSDLCPNCQAGRPNSSFKRPVRSAEHKVSPLRREWGDCSVCGKPLDGESGLYCEDCYKERYGHSSITDPNTDQFYSSSFKRPVSSSADSLVLQEIERMKELMKEGYSSKEACKLTATEFGDDERFVWETWLDRSVDSSFKRPVRSANINIGTDGWAEDEDGWDGKSDSTVQSAGFIPGIEGVHDQYVNGHIGDDEASQMILVICPDCKDPMSFISDWGTELAINNSRKFQSIVNSAQQFKFKIYDTGVFSIDASHSDDGVDIHSSVRGVCDLAPVLSIAGRDGYNFNDLLLGADLSQSFVLPDLKKHLLASAKFEIVNPAPIKRSLETWVVSGKDLDVELKKWGLGNPGQVFQSINVLGVSLDGSMEFPKTKTIQSGGKVPVRSGYTEGDIVRLKSGELVKIDEVLEGSGSGIAYGALISFPSPDNSGEFNGGTDEISLEDILEKVNSSRGHFGKVSLKSSGIRIDKPFYDDMPGLQVVIDNFEDGHINYDRAIAQVQGALEDCACDDNTANQIRRDVQQWMDSTFSKVTSSLHSEVLDFVRGAGSSGITYNEVVSILKESPYFVMGDDKEVSTVALWVCDQLGIPVESSVKVSVRSGGRLGFQKPTIR